jgi:hypothetical protein
MTLGGCTTNKNNDDDDDGGEGSSYDVQMEKIMQRFTNFNQILSETSGQDDDDDDEDEEAQEYIKGDIDEENVPEQDITKGLNYSSDQSVNVTPVKIKAPEELNDDFVDQSFWQIPATKVEEIDYDALLAELE